MKRTKNPLFNGLNFADGGLAGQDQSAGEREYNDQWNYGMGRGEASPWGFDKYQGEKIRNQEAFQDAHPGWAPGTGYSVNMGLGKRDLSGMPMQGFNAQMGGFRGTQGQQQALAQQLALQAAGKGGPTAAQSLFQGATDQNLRNAMALGQSQAGVSPGAGLRSILEAQSGATGQAASQAAALRAQEQLSAQGQLGGLYGQMAGQGLQAAGMYGQMSEQDRQAMIELERQRAGVYSSQVGANAQKDMANKQLVGNVLGEGMKGGAAAFGVAHGAEIEGRAKHDGDHEDNDTVPAMLSPGEIVLPRSVAQDPDAEQKAAEFVHAIKKHKKMYNGGVVGSPYGRLLARTKLLEARRKEIE